MRRTGAGKMEGRGRTHMASFLVDRCSHRYPHFLPCATSPGVECTLFFCSEYIRLYFFEFSYFQDDVSNDVSHHCHVDEREGGYVSFSLLCRCGVGVNP